MKQIGGVSDFLLEKFSDLLGRGSKLTLENEAVMNYFHLAKIMDDINNAKVLLIYKDWENRTTRFETLSDSEYTQAIIDLENKLMSLIKDHREEVDKLENDHRAYKNLMDTTFSKRVADATNLIEKKYRNRSLWQRIVNK